MRCRHIPAIIRGDDGEVEARSVLLTGFNQSETLGVATSTHGSQADATRVEKSQSCERFDRPRHHPQSAEDLRVESVRIIETESIEQINESAESGESVKTGCNSEGAEDREWGISLILYADTRVLRTKRRR